MLANYSQHQRRNKKMDLFIMIAVIFSLIVVFVGTQVAALFLFLKENERLREENEKFQPPF
jgi:flagellar basal body-associated protein FliL